MWELERMALTTEVSSAAAVRSSVTHLSVSPHTWKCFSTHQINLALQNTF